MNCFKNINLLSEISTYLSYKEIILFSMCCKDLNKLLDPKDNIVINTIFLLSIIDEYFEIEHSNYNNENKKNLLGKKIEFPTNWKMFLKQFKVHFGQYEDKTISQKVLDFFRIHIYLPDLRKECFHLEFENSSIHQLISYDINSRLIHTYNYYSKTINVENIILNPEKKVKIKILREKLKFEQNLINFTDLFQDFVNNEELSDFVNSKIIKYQYEELFDIYDDNNFHIDDICDNKYLSEVISFILWVNFIFILYCKFNYEYIQGLFNNINEEELLSEYISKKNDLINCALLINSTYDNANIIINFLSIFKKIDDDYLSDGRLSLCSSTDSESNLEQNSHFDEKKYSDMIISPNKFTLYNLFLKSIEKYYTSKLAQINEAFQTVSKSFFQEEFTVNSDDLNNKPKNEDKMKVEDEDSFENEINSDCDEDLSMDIDMKPTKKEIIESFLNTMVDRTVNRNNSNGIMHSFFKVKDWYINDYENILVNIFTEQILKSINVEKIPIDQCFNIIEKLTRVEGNSKSLMVNRDSLIVIRRTKKKLMKEGFCTIFPNLIEELSNDFENRIQRIQEDGTLYISAVEKLNTQNYKCDMDVLSEEGEENVTKHVEKEYEKTKDYLIKKNNLGINEFKLAEKYIENIKFPYVFLFKKFLWNYYKQLEIYNERDEKVVYFLTHFGQKYGTEDNCYIKEKKGEEEKNLESNDQSKDELWNNCNSKEKEEVPIDSKFI